jgi:hypothetical protein
MAQWTRSAERMVQRRCQQTGTVGPRGMPDDNTFNGTRQVTGAVEPDLMDINEDPLVVHDMAELDSGRTLGRIGRSVPRVRTNNSLSLWCTTQCKLSALFSATSFVVSSSSIQTGIRNSPQYLALPWLLGAPPARACANTTVYSRGRVMRLVIAFRVKLDAKSRLRLHF